MLLLLLSNKMTICGCENRIYFIERYDRYIVRVPNFYNYLYVPKKKRPSIIFGLKKGKKKNPKLLLPIKITLSIYTIDKMNAIRNKNTSRRANKSADWTWRIHSLFHWASIVLYVFVYECEIRILLPMDKSNVATKFSIEIIAITLNGLCADMCVISYLAYEHTLWSCGMPLLTERKSASILYALRESNIDIIIIIISPHHDV